MITQEENIKEVSKSKPYIIVKDLVTQFFTSKGIVKALDKVSFEIYPGEIYGLVGESGCGKSVTSTSIMDLIPDPPGRIMGGEIFIDSFNILSDLKSLAKIRIRSETDVKIKRNKRASKRHNEILSQIRGNKISMIFQEPFLALNPTMRIGDQIMESILLHNILSISDGIIKRNNLNSNDLDKFLKNLKSENDDIRKKKVINNFVTEFGIQEFEESLRSLIENSTDDSYVKTEIINMIQENKKNTDMKLITEIREYYYYRDQMFQLTLEEIQAERTGETAVRNQKHEQIKALRKYINNRFFVLRMKLRFAEKHYMAPFRKEARRRAIELLSLVNIAGPEIVVDSYPHELSGGMQQRAMIAMALASNPKMLIADEPTTALDVTTQAQILEIIKDLNELIGMGVLFITHDLAVIAEMCDRVGVMYAGNLVEETSTTEIFNDPKHPYTVGLMNSVPRADRKREREIRLDTIPGTVPNLITPPSGCRFHPRCKFAMDICSLKKPKLVEISPQHKVACFLYSDESEVD
ncbi:ABC transporter ATP-binding protein [Cuniculiplasma sp. SKW3]